MSKHDVIIAGFGGQGVLFTGKVLVTCGMNEGLQVSWLPSYGPEMRGGTANVSVSIDSEEIGSPLISSPNLAVAFNQPSFDKYEPAVVSGGVMFVDSSLVSSKSKRTDIKVFEIPATQLALENGLKGLANIIVLGKIIRETGIFTAEAMEKATQDCMPKSKQHLLEPNMKAFRMGLQSE